MKKIFLIILLSSPLICKAWTFGNNVTITNVILWEDDNHNPLYFKRSDNVMCYVPADQKSIRSLILTVYASGRRADIHCYDNAEAIMGGIESAHKLHRIIAK
ncbi:hypothetical protein [Zooshikella sp. RANM57]|uniref:hypothetical protein n=1 Tax=Zooshikella sp. RANM57 TaxID=3425863 RepID=UPI003D6F15B6